MCLLTIWCMDQLIRVIFGFLMICNAMHNFVDHTQWKCWSRRRIIKNSSKRPRRTHMAHSVFFGTRWVPKLRFWNSNTEKIFLELRFLELEHKEEQHRAFSCIWWLEWFETSEEFRSMFLLYFFTKNGAKPKKIACGAKINLIRMFFTPVWTRQG